MVVAGIRMLRDKGDTGTACKVGDAGINWRRCWFAYLVFAVAAYVLVDTIVFR
jgi:hypothetical protein